MELHILVALSTYHIRPATAQALEAGRDGFPFLVANYPEGVLVGCVNASEQTEGFPGFPELQALRVWAEKQGARYVLLDGDAETEKGLPTWTQEWDAGGEVPEDQPGRMVNGHSVAAIPPEQYVASSKTGSLSPALTSEDITTLLGVEPIPESSDGKVNHYWQFTVDAEECACWDYKGARWSLFGDPYLLKALFGEHYGPA